MAGAFDAATACCMTVFLFRRVWHAKCWMLRDTVSIVDPLQGEQLCRTKKFWQMF